MSEFMQTHGASMEIDTVYYQDAFSLRSDDCTKIVSVQHSVLAQGQHLLYGDGTRGVGTPREYLKSTGRHFSIHTTRGGDNALVSIAKKWFDPVYSMSKPVISDDQKHMCLTRNEKVEGEHMDQFVDVFDCSTGEFWESQHDLKPQGFGYLFTLVTPKPNKKERDYRDGSGQVKFFGGQYTCVQYSTKLLIYDGLDTQK